jgi:hypothetical protein
MIFFYFWLIFILGSILAVIITAIMGKRKQDVDSTQVEETESGAVEYTDGGAEEVVEEAAFQADEGADDFAAFENQFK